MRIPGHIRIDKSVAGILFRGLIDIGLPHLGLTAET